MNKRAETNWILLTSIIFIVIIALLFLGPLGGNGFGKIKSFFDNAPSFNESKSGPVKVGLTRYDIVTDKVEIYDGERWSTFKDGVEFESLGNPVLESDVNSAFDSYFFNAAARKGNPLFENTSLSVNAISIASKEYIDQSILINWFDEKVYSRGATIISVKPVGQAVLGYYFLDLNGDLVYKENTEQSDDEPLTAEAKSSMKSNAIRWRDNIFSNPQIKIQGKSFCLIKSEGTYVNGNRYLIIDLNKAGEVCGK